MKRDKHPDSPETEASWVGGWLSPIIVAALTLIWCFLIWWLIKDRPTNWNYGVTPYVPAESALSSQEPKAGSPPKQIEMPVNTRIESKDEQKR